MVRKTQDILDELAALQPHIRKDTSVEDLIDKAKEREAMAKDKTQVGATIDRGLWRRVRIRAVQEDKSAGAILEEALSEYLGVTTPRPAPQKKRGAEPADTTEPERLIASRPDDNARDIAADLNAAGYKTARGGEWTPNTVNKARGRIRKKGGV